MAFDIEGARKAGYSDAEIADYLAGQSKFDVAGARSSGYSDAEIVSHLSAPAKKEAPSKSGMSWSDAGLSAVKNIPKSGANLVGNIVQAISHPVDTASGLKSSLVGMMPTSFLPESAQILHSRDANISSAVGGMFRDRYGGIENIKGTLATDPVGMLADVSAVATGGGSLASRVPGAVGKAGRAISTAGKAIDPINMAGKAVGEIAKGGGYLASEVIGGIGTHTGGKPVRTAFYAGQKGGQHASDFADSMRGNIPAEQVVSEMKSALSEMRAQRGAAYRAGMAGVKSDPTVLSFKPIDDAWGKVASSGTYKGKSIAPTTVNIVKQIGEKLDEWRSGNPADFHTPEGLDALKQAVGDIRDSTMFGTPERRVADAAYHAIKGQIVKQAPGYGRTMREYENASAQLREIEKGLSLGKTASVDTALRKLQSVMRNNVNTNYGNRVKMVEQLADVGAPTIMEKLGGQAMSSWTPRGLGNIQAGGTAVAGLANPAFWGVLPFQSPRLVGEAALLAGRAASPVGAAARMSAPYANPAFQSGRIHDLLKNAGLLGE